MTVLFGTVEYFERKFLSYAEANHIDRLSQEQISAIHFKLKDELLNDFVCTERIRTECLDNLAQARGKLTNSEMLVMR